ncbi:type I methionyl aminopeptidase [Patescibacteria group bacterium]|nr:type I methionyl aminopeptidase [Patescibacteria group bacterium]
MARIKTEAEIIALREGGKRLAHAIAVTRDGVRPGVTLKELNDQFEATVRAAGDVPAFLNYRPRGAKRAFPSAICISVNEEVVHGIPTENNRVIKDGDVVKLDGGVLHAGLITDHAVTVIAGTARQEDAALAEATRDALYAGIAAARGGGRIGDISAAVEKAGVRAGYGIVFELGGHGVGHAVHEEPYVPNVGDAGEGELLEPGMVLAIEPMFTLGTPRLRLKFDGYTYVTKDGTRAAHWEHTVAIRAGEAEILTVL